MSLPRLVRHQVRPVLAARIGNRRRDDLEVLGAVGVGQDEEDVAAFLDVVFETGLARRDHFRLGVGIIGRHDPVFRRFVVVDGNEDPFVRTAAADTHEEARVGLLVDQLVFRAIRADPVVKVFDGRWLASSRV